MASKVAYKFPAGMIRNHTSGAIHGVSRSTRLELVRILSIQQRYEVHKPVGFVGKSLSFEIDDIKISEIDIPLLHINQYMRRISHPTFLAPCFLSDSSLVLDVTSGRRLET